MQEMRPQMTLMGSSGREAPRQRHSSAPSVSSVEKDRRQPLLWCDKIQPQMSQLALMEI
jgi:hypothetical protein